MLRVVGQSGVAHRCAQRLQTLSEGLGPANSRLNRALRHLSQKCGTRASNLSRPFTLMSGSNNVLLELMYAASPVEHGSLRHLAADSR